MVCRNLSAYADAPSAGSAEAKMSRMRTTWAKKDAPRAGSAEAKWKSRDMNGSPYPMHPVQAAQSKITTCRPMVL